MGQSGRLPDSPAEALASGMSLVPEDRRAQGIFPGQSVRENIVAAVLPRLTRRGLIDRRAVDALVSDLVESLDIKLASLDQPIEQLSGGNQQKVILARSLSDLAADGMAVLIISSELEEVLEGSHCAVVMRDGRTVGVLSGDDLSEESLVKLMSTSGPPGR